MTQRAQSSPKERKNIEMMPDRLYAIMVVVRYGSAALAVVYATKIIELLVKHS